MDYTSFNFWAIITVFAIELIATIIGSIYFKRIKPAFKPIYILFVASVTADATSYILIHHFQQSNLWVINLYTLVEFLTLALFYILIFKHTKALPWLIGFFSIVCVFVFIFTFYLPFESHTGEFAIAFEAIAMICVAVYYFYSMLEKMEYNTPYQNPVFWVNSGILTYLAGAFFFFMFRDPKYQVEGVDKIHFALHIIFVILLFIGFWKALRKSTY